MPKQPKQRQSTARRNPNGEGSIYQRSSDGRWVGQAYVLTTDGTRKRKFVYGATWDEAHAKLVELKSRSQRGIPVPDRAWKLADYLPYWLAAYVTDLKPTTARGYESAVRLHLIPALGSKRLDGLQVQHVKAFMDDFRRKCLCCTNGLDQIRPVDRRCCSVGRCCERYPSARQIQFVHAVLRNALQHAMREELVSRNVAKLVRVPSPRYKVGKGLSVDQVRKLLAASAGHRLHALYVVAATMGLRRGELVGLRWSDVDLDEGTLRVQQTVQRVAGSSTSWTPRPRTPKRCYRCPRSPGSLSLSTRSASKPSGRRWPRSGRTTTWSSPPSEAPRWSRPTSAARSLGCGTSPACPVFACTTSGTPSCPCSWSWAFRRTSSKPSPGTPTSRSR